MAWSAGKEPAADDGLDRILPWSDIAS